MWIYVCMSACLYVCLFACMSLCAVLLIVSRSLCLRPYLYRASRETHLSMYINVYAHMLTCFQPYIHTNLNKMLWGSGHCTGSVICIYCGCCIQPWNIQETRGASHVSQPVVQATPCCIATRHMMKPSTCSQCVKHNLYDRICILECISPKYKPNIRTPSSSCLLSWPSGTATRSWNIQSIVPWPCKIGMQSTARNWGTTDGHMLKSILPGLKKSWMRAMQAIMKVCGAGQWSAAGHLGVVICLGSRSSSSSSGSSSSTSSSQVDR